MTLTKRTRTFTLLTASLLGAAVFGVVLSSSVVGAQTEQVMCSGRVATIVGTPNDDFLSGTDGPDVIAGLQGNDSIDGLGGDDILCGGQGDDELLGGDGFDIIFGAQGNDLLVANGLNLDPLEDSRGARMFGGAGNDTIYGSHRWDRMQGGPGDDRMFGFGGRDWMRAGPGDDYVDSGGSEIDDIQGGNGSDEIVSHGADQLRGGAGGDICRFIGAQSAAEFVRSCERAVAGRPNYPGPDDGIGVQGQVRMGIDGFCENTQNSNAILLNSSDGPAAAYNNWSCGGQPDLDLDEVCEYDYGPRWRAVPLDANNAFSYVCQP